MLRKAYYFAKLWKNQWMKEEDLRRLQTKKMRAMIKHAYETIPYYNKLFKSNGLYPEDIKELKDLNKIPITTKEMLKHAGKSLLSRKYRPSNLIIHTTGGSTGKPVTIYDTKESMDISRASKLRTFIANGYRLNQKIAVFLFHGPKPRLFNKLGIHRTYQIPRYVSMDEEIMLLQKIKAEVFDGFPSKIAEVAKYVNKNNITTIKPKIIFTNSETLHDANRRFIREQFVDPINVYVSREFKYIAWECNKRKGLHINSDLLILQILDPDRNWREVKEGESGDIVITDLANYAMPLIRYNAEDIGTYTDHKCSCGRNFPLLKRVLGKKSEFLVLPSGRKVLGASYFSDILSKYKEIEQYHVRQKKNKSVEINLVAKKENKSMEKGIIQEIKNSAENLKLTIKYVDSIKKTEVGKFFPFISEIK